ncbi:MAG: hypothetical protein HFJ27_00865 [Clostridia bacterium]|nr:hypothetical protein [Clostridia bacterium]
MYLLNAPKYAIEHYLTEDIQAIFGIILMPASVLPLFAQLVIAPITNKITNLYKQNEIEKLEKVQNKMIFAILGFRTSSNDNRVCYWNSCIRTILSN